LTSVQNIVSSGTRLQNIKQVKLLCNDGTLEREQLAFGVSLNFVCFLTFEDVEVILRVYRSEALRSPEEAVFHLNNDPYTSDCSQRRYFHNLGF